jgi:hypothetical protein
MNEKINSYYDFVIKNDPSNDQLLDSLIKTWYSKNELSWTIWSLINTIWIKDKNWYFQIFFWYEPEKLSLLHLELLEVLDYNFDKYCKFYTSENTNTLTLWLSYISRLISYHNIDSLEYLDKLSSAIDKIKLLNFWFFEIFIKMNLVMKQLFENWENGKKILEKIKKYLSLDYDKICLYIINNAIKNWLSVKDIFHKWENLFDLNQEILILIQNNKLENIQEEYKKIVPFLKEIKKLMK